MIPLLCLVRAVSPKEVYDGDAGATAEEISVYCVCVCVSKEGSYHVCVSFLRILQLLQGCVFFTHHRCPVGNVYGM